MAVSNADKALEILFGVKGGGDVKGDSGQLILKQLNQIVKGINGDEGFAKLKISIDVSSLNKQIDKIKQSLSKIVVDSTATISKNKTDGKKSDSGNSDNIIKSNQYKEATQSITDYYQAIERVEKAMTRTNAIIKDSNGEYSFAKDAKQYEIDRWQATVDGANAATAARRAYNEAMANTKLSAEQIANLQNKEMASEANLARNQAKNNASAQSSWDKLAAKVQDYISRVQDSASRDKEATRQLQRLKQLAESGNPKYFDELNRKLGETQQYINKNNLATETWFQKFKKTFGTRVRSIFSAAIVAKIAQGFREVYEQVVEIDTAMTQLKIVTRASSSEMQEYTKIAIASAKAIGTSVSELTNSTTAYARLGYNLKDAEKLAEITTQYSKVADVDVNTATANITAMIKAYNVGANELESIVDKLIYVGNEYAISSAEIGEGMNNAASSLVANGNTFDQALGLLTAANVTLQNISKSSTGLRTISARLAAATTELEELGESADDLMTTAKLDKFMQAFGVRVTDVNGHLRSTYDILNDLSKVWNTLSSEQMSSIAGQLAGTRQQNVFYSIMQNFGDAQKIVGEIDSASGSLANATETRLDSIQGKFDQLKASFQEFAMNLLDSQLIKDAAGVGNFLISILNGVAKLINLMGGLKTILVQVMAIIAVKNFTKIKNGITGFSTKILRLIAYIRGAQRAGASTTESLSFGFSKIGVSISAAQIALTAFTAALTIGIMIFNSIKQAREEYVASLKESADAALEESKAVAENVKSLNELAEEYKSITEKDGWKTSVESSSRVEEIQNQITELVGEQAKNLDLVNGKLDDEYDKLKNISDVNIDKAITKAKVAVADLELAYSQMEKKREWSDNSAFTLIPTFWSDAERAIVNLSGAEYAISAGGSGAGAFGYFKNDYNNISDFVSQYEKLIEIQNKLANAGYTKGHLYGVVHQYISYYKEIYEKYVEARDYLNELNELKVEFDNPPDPEDAFAGQIVVLKSLKEILEEVQDGYDGLSEAMSDMASYGQLTSKTLSNLIKLVQEGKIQGLQLNDIVVKTAKGYELVDGALEKYIDKLLTAYTVEQEFANEESRANAIENLENLKAVLMTLLVTKDTAKDAASELKSAYEKEKDLLNDRLNKYKELVAIRKDLLESYEEELKYNRELEKKTKNVAKLQTQLTLARLDTSAAGQARVRNLEQELSDAQEDLDDFTLEHAIDVLVDDLDSQYDEYEKMIKASLQQISDKIDSINSNTQVNTEWVERAVAKIDSLIDQTKGTSVTGVVDQMASDKLRAIEPFLKDVKDDTKLQSNRQNWPVHYDNSGNDESVKLMSREEYDKKYPRTIQWLVGDYESYLEEMRKKYPGTYHDGGYVGGLNTNEEFAKLLKGEFVSTPAQIQRFMSRTLPKIVSSGTNEFNAPLISIQCDNVTRESLPGLKDIVDKAVATIEKKLDDGFSRTGYKRTTNKI